MQEIHNSTCTHVIKDCNVHYTIHVMLKGSGIIHIHLQTLLSLSDTLEISFARL